MNNIVKNLILGFTLVCVIVLIVFCIQLIVINRGVERTAPDSSASGGSQQGSEDPGPGPGENGEEPTNGTIGNGGTNGDVGNTPAVTTPRPPPQGTRRSLQITENDRLILYVDEESFDFEQGDLDWWFLYTRGMATLEIKFTLVTQGAAEHAEAFLNNYSGGTQASFVGEESIQGSALRGYHVSTMVAGEVYEAWIHTIPNYDLSLAFVINYTNDQEKDALYDLLSTLEME